MKIQIFLSIVLFPLWLFGQYPLQSTLLKLVNDASLKGTKWSICAIDLVTGDTLAAFQPRQQLPGASITKLISSAASLAYLGPAHCANTRLVIEGKINANGVLDGNIRIVGGGDISLGSKYFLNAGAELQFLKDWVAILKQNGIQQITGNIIADTKEFGVISHPLGWEQADMGCYYGSGAYGLNFYDNLLKVYMETGAVGTQARLKNTYPHDKHYMLKSEAKAADISYDNSYILGKPYQDVRTIKGRLPAHQSSFEIKASMSDPERLLAEVFFDAIKTAGIRIDGSALTARTATPVQLNEKLEKRTIHTQQGKTLSEIIFWTNHRSVNHFAEANLLQLGFQRFGSGTYENSLIVLDSILMSWGVGPCRIVDGSGLSRQNRMSSAQFVQLLKKQTTATYFNDFYKSLPVAGVSGTVASLCKGQAGDGKVHAKSGTLTGVKSFAGYVDSKSGHQIAFAIIANNFSISGNGIAKKMEPFLNSLATYQVQP